jgi:hypothetical protein
MNKTKLLPDFIAYLYAVFMVLAGLSSSSQLSYITKTVAEYIPLNNFTYERRVTQWRLADSNR